LRYTVCRDLDENPLRPMPCPAHTYLGGLLHGYDIGLRRSMPRIEFPAEEVRQEGIESHPNCVVIISFLGLGLGGVLCRGASGLVDSILIKILRLNSSLLDGFQDLDDPPQAVHRKIEILRSLVERCLTGYQRLHQCRLNSAGCRWRHFCTSARAVIPLESSARTSMPRPISIFTTASRPHTAAR